MTNDNIIKIHIYFFDIRFLIINIISYNYIRNICLDNQVLLAGSYYTNIKAYDYLYEFEWICI